jgi:zinc protease
MLNVAFETYHLSNGLKIIVHEDHSVPKAVVNILYRVGSKDEEPEKTGFAHLFEHLMFEGSVNVPHYDTELQKVGGDNNAFTSCDITNYYLTVPSNQLETAFWLESDRMLALDFSQDRLDNQKSVVIEEFKQRYLNQPYGDAMNLLRETHFSMHPYQWATIGREISHIENATLDYVKEFFYGYYAPNNATLVVAGDVKPDEVLRLAEKWFGSIPTRTLKKHSIPQEPKQTEAKFITKEADVPYIGVYKMFHIPGHTEREYYIADIITDLLSGGKSGKLYQDLVINQQIASSAGAFTWGMHEPGALSINAQLAEGKSIEKYEKALRKTLNQLKNLTEEDLQRIKNKLQSQFLLEKVYVLNKAMGLAFADSLGDANILNQTPKMYASLTLEEVKKGAKEYLAESNSSTLYYLPKK